MEYQARNGFKKCNKCNRVLPANTDYYYLKKDTHDGFNNRCKECMGKKFTDYLTHIPKEGHVFCKKCGRELPHTFMYFPVDKSCSTGLRFVCRECNPSYGRFLEEDEFPNEQWSDEDKNILIENYSNYTGLELKEKFFKNRSVRSIECMASILDVNKKSDETYKRSRMIAAAKTSEKTKGIPKSVESRLKLSESKKKYYETHDSWWKGKKRSKEQCEQISRRMKESMAWSGDNNPRHLKPLFGENNGRWKGGIKTVYTQLRSEIKDWFNESMMFSNYSCVITGLNFDNIHHTTPFKDIVEIALENMEIDPNKGIGECSESDLKLIKRRVIDLHTLFGFGAPLLKNVHKLFHDKYGYTNFTPYDFLDFIYRIDRGEYDDWFENNSIIVNINYGYVEYLENILLDLCEKKEGDL